MSGLVGCSCDARELTEWSWGGGGVPAGKARRPPGCDWTCGKRAQIIQVDDSFRQIGVTRALQIAREYGGNLPEDTARYAPKWLVLRRSAEAPEYQRQFWTHTPHRAQQPQKQEPGLPAPSASIPLGRHSIAGEIGERIRLRGAGPWEVGLAWIAFESGVMQSATSAAPCRQGTQAAAPSGASVRLRRSSAITSQ